MTDRYFLYMDILGFTDLVKAGSKKIDDLYETIASLNVHSHSAFKVVVFSDTIVVYNVDGGDTPEDSSYLIMFLCEFVKDLMHRLTDRNIYFRAVITHGDFTHYELNGMPCFYGNALVDAYNSEKEIKAVGLFIHKSISKYCDIFKFREYNQNYDFVYVTQSLREIDFFGQDGFPIPWDLIEPTEAKWQIYPEAAHVSNMYRGWKNSSFPESVRKKYKASWDMYCKQYPNLTKFLVQCEHDISHISPTVNWNEVIEKYPAFHSYCIEKKC